MWKEILDDVFRKTLAGFGERLAAFGPNLLAMLVILAIGVLVATSLRLLVRVVLPWLGFDRFAARAGVTVVLQKGGITSPPSSVLATGLAWAVLGVFLILAIGALDLQIAMNLLAQALAYLPQVLIAGAILLLGSLVSAFLRRSALLAAVNAGLASARLLAGAVHTALMVLFVAMALEHLGLGRQVILVSFTILFGGLVFAVSLSFGLAGRDLARDMLARLASRAEPGSSDERRQL
jgi:mechanosensitive ion channel-like protein